jgi:hypothetical protein
MIVTCQRGGHRAHARGQDRHPPIQEELFRAERAPAVSHSPAVGRLADDAQLAWPFILDNRFYDDCRKHVGRLTGLRASCIHKPTVCSGPVQAWTIRQAR